MIIPSKEETVANNLLVQGARVVQMLKGGALNIEDLRSNYPTKSRPMPPTMERLFDVLTYLYITGFIVVDGVYIALKQNGANK
jgi:hypothetical protein